MTELRHFIEKKCARGEKLLSVYLTAGFPAPAATPILLEAIARGGADIIELGVPFSDPLADGPVIQHAAHTALQAGVTMRSVLEMLHNFRSNHDIPTLLMGYANPFLRYGLPRLMKDSGGAGGSGFIVPDLPPEERGFFRLAAAEQNLDFICLAAPNTPENRLQRIDELTGAFIYAVSVTGVTGARAALPAETVEFLQRLRRVCRHPLLVGFGISGPETVRSLRAQCDGVVVGSALIRGVAEAVDLPAAAQFCTQFVSELKKALGKEPS